MIGILNVIQSKNRYNFKKNINVNIMLNILFLLYNVECSNQ